MMGGVYGQHLPVAQIIERLYQSSAALTGAEPRITRRALNVVLNPDLFFDLGLILLQIQRWKQPGIDVEFLL